MSSARTLIFAGGACSLFGTVGSASQNQGIAWALEATRCVTRYSCGMLRCASSAPIIAAEDTRRIGCPEIVKIGLTGSSAISRFGGFLTRWLKGHMLDFTPCRGNLLDRSWSARSSAGLERLALDTHGCLCRPRIRNMRHAHAPMSLTCSIRI